MASREELSIIRAARAGQVAAQLALGERYLFGGGDLPQSLVTALHWLERAARQNCEQAWALIGRHIPYDVAAQSPNTAALCLWYERAFDAGDAQAGMVFARLLLAQDNSPESQRKALQALESAASAGLSEAHWLLAEMSGKNQSAFIPASAATREPTNPAAKAGTVAAQQSLENQAWESGDRIAFLQWALPQARAIVQQHLQLDTGGQLAPRLGSQNALLLSRCAQVLSERESAAPDEVQQFWELAAQEGDEAAPYLLGLWLARLDENGTRRKHGPVTANVKKALRWLSLAAENGSAKACYALSRLYLKPEFSQRNPKSAQQYLGMAADKGHASAQFECGVVAWRARREEETSDVRATFWLQQATAQGHAEASAMLDKVAPRAQAAPWALTAQALLTREMRDDHRLLTARIELAALFGLSRAEALLLNVHQAEQGHCLVVDIRANYGRSKRRLIRLDTVKERQDISRIARIFDNIDPGVHGPEGNYRQRLYRLKSLLPGLVSE